jgi:hypothetical protein
MKHGYSSATGVPEELASGTGRERWTGSQAVALISLGARGQGEAEVRLFVQEGAKVVFGDVLDDVGEVVAKDVGRRLAVPTP